MNEKGSIVWRILFGVVMAGLLIGILLAYTSTQKEYATGKEAQNLADSLSKTAFSAIQNKQQTFQLYKAVGDSNYELNVKNNTFIIKISGTGPVGRQYRSTVGADLEVSGNLPEPGETLYLRGDGEKVIVSSEPIDNESEDFDNYGGMKNSPDFYEFAKNNPKTATGLIAAYFHARENYGGDIDVGNYEWDSSNNLRVKIVSGNRHLTTFKVRGEENNDNVGLIDNVWTVENISQTNENIENPKSPDSIKEAYSRNWLYTPNQVKETVKGRIWRDNDDDTIEISQEIQGKASAATTNVSTYPTWRFEIEKGKTYIFHLAAIPWKYDEKTPGFAFESEPELVAIR